MKYITVFNKHMSKTFCYTHYDIYINSDKFEVKFPRSYIINHIYNFTYYAGNLLEDIIIPMNLSDPDETISKFNSLLMLK